jgi:hypothetical protein
VRLGDVAPAVADVPVRQVEPSRLCATCLGIVGNTEEFVDADNTRTCKLNNNTTTQQHSLGPGPGMRTSPYVREADAGAVDAGRCGYHGCQ